MVRISARSFRKSKENLLDSSPDTPNTPTTPTPPARLPNGDFQGTDGSDERDSSDSGSENFDPSAESACSIHHDGRVHLDMEAPYSVDELFTMLFTQSKFTLYSFEQKNIVVYDLSDQWHKDPETKSKTRVISFTLPLVGLGPKESTVTETQIMNKCSRPGVRYSIDVLAENGGIPYADSFHLLVHYCLERRGERSTRLVMYTQIVYRKSVWGVVKAFIEKGAFGGMEEHGRLLEKLLRSYGTSAAPPKRKPRLKHTDTSSSLNAKHAPAPAPRPARTARAGLRTAWTLLLMLLLVAINVQLYYILNREQSKPCLMNVDGWEDRLYEGYSEQQVDEWAELLEEFSNKQRLQLIAIKSLLYGEIETLQKTEQAISKMIDKLKPTQKSREDTKRRLQEMVS